MTVDMDLQLEPTLKALAEPLRWSIVAALAREELCVCHLAEDLEVQQSLISHHLRVLRDAGLVEGERWRYWTYYRLRPEAFSDAASVLRELGTRRTVASSRRRPCC
jgi:ArsR family transcriptional regulator